MASLGAFEAAVRVSTERAPTAHAAAMGAGPTCDDDVAGRFGAAALGVGDIPGFSRGPFGDQIEITDARHICPASSENVDNATSYVTWEVAHLPYKGSSQPKPVLIDIYERGAAALPNYEAVLANNGWDPATKTFPAKLGEVIEIVFQITGSGGPSSYDADANNAKLAELGFKSVKCDTTMLL
ncbi:hypothetical protein MMYC01_200954 [Madurella mycetomatis]|uniref:Uncharacterized protein n=1 Tax=Madurella mycetomatis TaxID=100816 RepID=A0A175WF38_9PEZI|nr:hypothetical protein MMYC01_205662 [Madurella mycetomatis]KXX82161.1 hypothetical protein MMYC01_200954 [Madurella mycetomatis]